MTTTTENNAKEKTTTTKTKSKAKPTAAGAKKNFILDTNVILHDFNCLDNFEENDIYIPFVVLEELDKFKKGNAKFNSHARPVVRELDLTNPGGLFTHGAELGVGRRKLYIVLSPGSHRQIARDLTERTPANRMHTAV